MANDRAAREERDERARTLRVQGNTWTEIGRQLGFTNGTSAFNAARRAMLREPVLERLDKIDEEEHRINWLIGQAVAMLQEHHYIIEGKDAVVVQHPETGEYLDDYRPKIEALKMIQALSRDRRRLLGLDVPTRRVVEVLTDDRISEEIQRLEAEMADNDQLLRIINGDRPAN